MKERVKFVLEWEKRWNEGEGRLNFAQLCREFGISRQVGYDCVERYRAANSDVRSLQERSRRPLSTPTKVADEVEDFIVAARKLHPTWGPKKLRAWLMHEAPRVPLPAPSTIGEILHRRGMTRPLQRRERAMKATTQPFGNVTGPNATWCVDFKGNFRTSDGITCYPLTLIDAHSRLLLRCEGLLEPDGRQVQRVFDSAFSEFGLPSAIRSDNGPPFASVGAGGLTKLSVWWIRLGIRLERIASGKPQQNGRQERVNLREPPCVPSSAHSTSFARSTTRIDRMKHSIRNRPRPPMPARRDGIRDLLSDSSSILGTLWSALTGTVSSAGRDARCSSAPPWLTKTSSSATTVKRKVERCLWSLTDWTFE